MYRLFAYPDSSNLYESEENLIAAFLDFVRSWPVGGVLLTNKKAPMMEGQNIPDWNLGLRVETQQLNRENVEQLLSFVSELSLKVNLPFVLGTWTPHAETRDLCFVDRHVPDGAAGLILKGAHAA